MPSAKASSTSLLSKAAPGWMRRPAQGHSLGRELLKKTGIAEGRWKALKSAGPKRILDAQRHYLQPLPPRASLTMPIRGFVPSVDGIALPRNHLLRAAPALSAHIPILIGSNKDEMTIFRTRTRNSELPRTQILRNMCAKQLPGKAESSDPGIARGISGLFAQPSDYSFGDFERLLDCHGTSSRTQGCPRCRPGLCLFAGLETRWMEGGSELTTLRSSLVFNNVETSRSMVGPGPSRSASPIK